MSRITKILAATVLLLAAGAVAAPAPKKAAVKPNARNGNPGVFRVKSYAAPSDPALAALARQSALVSISLNEGGGVRVPASFLGLSLDLNDIEGVAHPDFIGIIKRLTQFDTGPLFMRVGAYSADRLIKPWPGTVYKALASLHKATGTRFIVGANQHAEDPKVTSEQVQRSLKLLPPNSVVSFAIGNEPDMYALPARDGLPGASLPKAANWLSTKWIPVSKVIFKAGFEAAGSKRMLAGPDWSDSTMEDKKLTWWLAGVKDYLNMVTVHHYGGNILKDKAITSLLDDARMVSKISNLKNLVKVCNDNGGLPLRITEAATLSYGGVQGVSDVSGAAVWALDTALEVAYTGTAGIHFHQVLTRRSNANYNAIYYAAEQNKVRVRQPLYGYLMLQEALAGGADILGRAVTGGCKAWLLRGRKSGELRALVINKADGKECGADVRLSPDQLRRFGGAGEADYLYAAGGLTDPWRTYFSDSFFDQWGAGKQRERQSVPVQRYLSRDAGGKGKVTGGGFAVHLTKGTLAALVSVPKATAAQQKAFDAARWAAPGGNAKGAQAKGSGKNAAPAKGGANKSG